MKHSSLEALLWIEITLATFSFLRNTPGANVVLKMIERCSNISSASSLRILVWMLFGPADFLGLKFEIISIIFSFVQGQMKSKSWLGGDKYSKNLLYEKWHFWVNFCCYGEEETNKSICNCSRISNGMVFETNYFWWIICRFLERNYGSDSFPGVFHVIDIIIKIPVIIFFLLYFRRVEIIFLQLL